jgi:dynein heavy chain, axonemal
MRAVKSIILAAGALKRDYPTENEAVLALRAISDCNIPKFLTDDIPLFEGIISDLFPTTDKRKPSYQELIASL